MKPNNKKDKRPAFQFYPGDWLSSSSVSLMSPAEEGAYLRLLCHAWMAEDCGLPDDDAVLAELSRLRGQWKKSADKIRRKFESIGGRLFNARLAEERVKQDEWRDHCSKRGKAGAAGRWPGDAKPMPQASQADASSIAQAMPKECSSIDLAMPKNGSSVFSLQSSNKTLLSAADAAVKKVAGEMHCRHPSARRDIGVDGIEKKLRAILKFKGKTRDGWEEYLEQINLNHRVLCESHNWQKDGGEFAKALSNWLAPREERYESAPPSLLSGARDSMEERFRL